MTLDDRKKWDARYLRQPQSTDPAAVVKRYWPLAARGKALDLACGNGRNGLFLAEKGFRVDAVDISTVATDRLAGRHPNLNVICADLDNWTIPPGRYALIVNVRFLDRRLFPMIRAGLEPGGVLVFESFIGGMKPEYRLAPNELLHAFLTLRIVYYAERQAQGRQKAGQTATLVAVKASPGDRSVDLTPLGEDLS